MNTVSNIKMEGGLEKLTSHLQLLVKEQRQLLEEQQRKQLQMEVGLKMLTQQLKEPLMRSQEMGETVNDSEMMETWTCLLNEDRSVTPEVEGAPTPLTAGPPAEKDATDSSPPSCSLHKAAEQGDLETLLRVLAEGERVDVMDASGNTALHVAAERGHVAIVKALIAGGAAMAARGALRRSALHMAAANGHVNVVRCLVGRGAVLGRPDAQGDSPLTLAAAGGHAAALEVLLKLTVKPEEMNRCLCVAGNATVVWTLLDDARLVTVTDNAIVSATSDGRATVLEALMQAGYRNNKYNAFRCAAEKGNTACLQVLLREGCDPNTKLDGATALHLAAANAHEECVRILLDAGADVKAHYSDGCTALHKAAEGGATQCAQLLINAGTDVNAVWQKRTSAGYMQTTPLQLASNRKDQDIVSMLLERGARKN